MGPETDAGRGFVVAWRRGHFHSDTQVIDALTRIEQEAAAKVRAELAAAVRRLDPTAWCDQHDEPTVDAGRVLDLIQGNRD